LSQTINTNGVDDLHLNIAAFQGEFTGSGSTINANQFETVDQLYVRVSDGGSNSADLVVDSGIWGDGLAVNGIGVTSPVASGWIALPDWADDASGITIELGFESNQGVEDYFVDRVTLATPEVVLDQDFAPGGSLADWTLSPADRFSFVSVQDGAAQNQDALMIAGGGASNVKTLQRTLNVAGLPDLAIDVTAFQGQYNGNNNAVTVNQFENVDLFLIEASVDGTNFVSVYQDNGPFGNGVDDTGPANTTPASTGLIQLPAALQNQAQLTIRLSVGTNVGSEDVFIQNITIKPNPKFFSTVGLSDGSTPVPTANTSVVGRNIFYNGSVHDGDVQASVNDDLAIATDKSALLPGQTATSDSYTSYSNGINGIMIDIASLRSTQLTASDFEVKVGNDNNPAAWSLESLISSVTIRPGDGIDGSDRVTLLFEPESIVNTWIEIRVLANTNTGLDSDDVFYFGNWIGETGNDSTTSVDASDRILVNNNQTSVFDPLATTINPYDFNRDGKVDGIDRLLSLNSQTSIFSHLTLITAPEIEANYSA
ncbi:MAG: hypothetical protein AAGI37_15265, partial [Planctomycetota bacterium]